MTSRTALKAYFNTGDTITEANVADLIDSLFCLEDDDFADVTGLTAQLDAKAAAYAYVVQSANRTLTSTTSAQALFNESASGAVTLATGFYRFECGLYLTSMSATSGNGQFQLRGGGTAVLADVLYQCVGVDNFSPTSGSNRTGSSAITQATSINMVTALTGPNLAVTIQGVFQVTAQGTLIPSIALTNEAAAVLQEGSYFIAQRLGGTATGGMWS